jgi:anti-sigma28 factor (negative regulator of flagellin synthesis)
MLRRSNENETQLNRLQTLRYHPAHKNKKRGADATGRFGRSGGSKNADSTRRTDMEVHGPGFVSGAAPIQGAQRIQKPTEVKSPLEVPQDEVEISAAGQLASKLTDNVDGALRAERLARIKAEIDAGVFDTDAKLEAALLKMFDQHGIDLEG